MTKRPTLTLLTIALLALPASGAPEGKTYYSYFKKVSTIQTVHLGQTPSELASTTGAAGGLGVCLADINLYRDAAGNERFDSIWEPGSSNWTLVMESSLSAFISEYIQKTGNGKRLVSFTSSPRANGDRSFAASFGNSNGAHAFIVDSSESKFVQDYVGNSSQGLRLTAVDTFLNPDGERRYHAVYNAGNQAQFMKVGMTLSEFEAMIINQHPLQVKTFEAYVDPDGVTRVLAVWESVNPASGRFYAAQTEAEFLATYQSETSSGYELVDLENLTYATPSWSNYGAGLAGTSGVPALTIGAEPYLGLTVDLTVGNSSGAPSLCGFFTGFTTASLPFAGGSLLVDPVLAFYFPVPTGGATLPVTLPFDTAFGGLDVYSQVAQQDPGAPEGISLSRGLKMTFGRLE